jgi:translation initiation factor 2 subunit 1
MIHISEIAPGRIRNIRDYVKEGKFIVCKALNVDKEKQQVDLSLRRVNERERREKTNQITLEKRAEKIVEHAAKSTGVDTNELYTQLTTKLFKDDYDFIYDAFIDVSEGKLKLDSLGLPPKVGKALQQMVDEKIKPPETIIKGHLKLSSFAPNGVEIIRDGTMQARASVKGKFSIRYEGGGGYSLIVSGPDFEKCEATLKSILSIYESVFSKSQGTVSFEKV